ncbi:MAG: hypothetical protein ACRD2O_08705, partial [Terriglobia bacterium]
HKDCNRVLSEGNVFSNTWAAVDQHGVVFQEGPLSSSSNGTLNYCWNYTVRYNLIRGGETAFDISTASIYLGDNAGATEGTRGFNFHDNVFEDLDGKWSYYGCWNYNDHPSGCQMNYAEMLLFSGTDSLSQGPMYITVDHNDFIGTVDAYTGQFYQASNSFPGNHFVLANNIFYYGRAGNGFGGASQYVDNCDALYATFPAPILEGNIFVGSAALGLNVTNYENCKLWAPANSYLQLSATGGSIPDSYKVFTEITFSDATRSVESAPSDQDSVAGTWTAGGKTGPIIDTNGGMEQAYQSGTPGTVEPTWPANTVANLDTITPDNSGVTCTPGAYTIPPGCNFAWYLRSNNPIGSVLTQTPGGTSSVLVLSPPATEAGEQYWNVYACQEATGSGGCEKLCNTSPIAVGTNFSLTNPATQCTGVAPPIYPGTLLSPTQPTWGCFPTSWAALDFVNYQSGDYRLAPASCGYHAAIDTATFTNTSFNWQEYPNWAASIVHSQFDTIIDSNGNYETAMNAGTTGASAPTWPTVAGHGVSDGSVNWVMSTALDVGARIPLILAKIAGVANDGTLAAPSSGGVVASGGVTF